jgi:MerR family transcriptional regulator, light-induced transcriptional regulator
MYSIKAVSQATGVSIETLRAWERRYQVVEPRRDPNGRRSYDPADVIRLRKLHEATERGHPISKLARLSDDELSKIIDAERKARPESTLTFSQQMLNAAQAYQPDDCDQVLSMAMALLPLKTVVMEVLGPTLIEVGRRWHEGEFTIAQERIVTITTRKQVSSVLDTYNRIATGSPVVFATLGNERHELGILMCALLTAARGLRCHYLGPELPGMELATYADRVNASTVVISMVSDALIAQASIELEQLLKYLPKHVNVCIGGSASETLTANIKDSRVSVCKDYQGYEEILDARLAKLNGQH